VFGESRIRDILMKKIILILLTGDEMWRDIQWGDVVWIL
jgi:hypothetical protein